ncbi:MAG: rRNA pseudouridine synthase [Oscillospiraceae bacterium]|nr:rRNA pseudouridine synthase [Oscillospiraceae bacterium]
MAERIQKIISAHGIASRREAEMMILNGRVAVNGIPATLGQQAALLRDEITIDGVLLNQKDPSVYIMLNKPRGYLTTLKDDRGRKTVKDLVADVGTRVYPAGRLDMDSEGLLILTNDGQFANAVMHPSNNKAKTYEVRVRGDAENGARLMRLPMEIDSYTIRPAEVMLKARADDGGILQITIREGRNRQIRKMCAKCSLAVLSLKRMSVGTLELGALKPGKWRYLTREEVEMFLN